MSAREEYVATIDSNGLRLYVEETGTGTPIVFVHEFAGDCRSWEPQVRYLSRRYRCITYNARGYPPSDVPEDPDQYSATHAVNDLANVVLQLGLDKAHIVGLSMGGYAALNFGLRYPHMTRSLVVAGAGSGSDPDTRSAFLAECDGLAGRLLKLGMREGSLQYANNPTRKRFHEKDARGFEEFCRQFGEHSALGSALTMRGYQMRRATIYELEPQLRQLQVPTLIMTGDDDGPCVAPALYMKQTIPAARLWIVPHTTHQINLEEPDAFNRAVLDFISTIDQKG
jgi:pimeloyl-ACP methyl ester carboxylesterase